MGERSVSGSIGMDIVVKENNRSTTTQLSLEIPKFKAPGRALLRIKAFAAGTLVCADSDRSIAFKQGVSCLPLDRTSSAALKLLHGPEVQSIDLVTVPDVQLHGTQQYACPVVCGMASIPSRVDVLRVAVDSILPQVDHLFIYLNGFDSVPGFLLSDKVTVFRSSDYGDYRDNSKFFGLRCFEDDVYFFSIDDDIEYPPDYVPEMVAAIERFDREAVVGVHGVVYGTESRLFLDRGVLHFRDQLEADVPVSALGTGTTAFHTSTLEFDCLEFSQVGMADLVMAQLASERGVPMIAVARPSAWLRALAVPTISNNLYAESILLDSAHDVFIRSGCVPGPSTLLHTSQASHAVWQALGPESKAFLEFLVAVESGGDPARMVAPPGGLLAHLAERLHWPALALASARGALLGCWHSRRILASATASLRGAMLGVSESALAGLVTLVDEYIQSLEIIGALAAHEAVDEPLESQGFSTARAYGDTALGLAFIIARLVTTGSPKVLLQLYPELRQAGHLELSEEVYGALSRLSPQLASEALLEKALLQLEAGATEDVLEQAPQLIESGDLGRQFVAIGGIRAGKYWSEDLVLSVFSGARNARQVRRVRNMTKILAREALPACSPELWADRIPGMHPEVRRLAASVLLANGAWSDRISFESLGIDDGVESVLWRTAAKATSGLSFRQAQHAVNSVFIAAGLSPVEISGDGEGNFFRALAGHPMPPFRNASVPLVSVIMAAFKSQDSIDYALRSVLAQSYPNIEVIIIDDFSPVPLRLPEWACSRPDVVLRRVEKNCGPYECRNIALELARGDFIATQDADDWMHPQKLERQVRALTESNAVVSYNRHIRLLANGAPALENNGQFIGDGPITSMFRRPVFDAIGRFMPVRTRGDMEFKSRVVNRYRKARVLHDDAVTLLALDSPASNSKVFTQSAADFHNIGKFKHWYSIEQPIAYFRKSPAPPIGLGRMFDVFGKE